MARLSMADRLMRSGGATVKKLEDARNRLQGQSEEHTEGQSEEQTLEQPIGLSGGLSLEQSEGQSKSLKEIVTVPRSVPSTVQRADQITDRSNKNKKRTQKDRPKDRLKNARKGIPGEDPFFWMTINHKTILLYIDSLNVPRTSLKDISRDTGIPYGTVRKVLRKLHSNDCITNPKKINIGPWQGLHIELLENGREWISQKDRYKDTHKNGPKDRHEDALFRGQTQGQTLERSEAHSLISSSSLNNKTTTCQDLETVIETHPELGYWRSQGLKSRLVDNWAVEFNLPHNDIIQSLCHCAFDMIDNGLEAKKNIRDPFDWIYKIIEKSGFYKKPKNYKSHLEKQIEREQERLEKIKRQTFELMELRKEKISAEHNLNFEKMLADEDSEIFRECFNKIPDLFKKPNKKGSISYLNAMKKGYCEINDIEDF